MLRVAELEDALPVKRPPVGEETKPEGLPVSALDVLWPLPAPRPVGDLEERL